MSMSVVVQPEYDISRIITAFEKYAKRAERRLEEIRDQLQCDICYEGYKSCEYQCNHHRVCKICYSKIHLCPFCRAPQVGVYPDLWYCHGSSFDFRPLTESVVRNGFRSDYIYHGPQFYAHWFDSSCRAGITQLTTFQDHPESIKMIIRVVADCLNKRANFPIFVWQYQKHIHYDAGRWKVILEAIAEKTQARPGEIPELRTKLKSSLCRLLKKIKGVATKAGLRYRVA